MKSTRLGENYFNGLSELCSSKGSVSERGIGALKVVSYCTIVIPALIALRSSGPCCSLKERAFAHNEGSDIIYSDQAKEILKELSGVSEEGSFVARNRFSPLFPES